MDISIDAWLAKIHIEQIERRQKEEAELEALLNSVGLGES